MTPLTKAITVLTLSFGLIACSGNGHIASGGGTQAATAKAAGILVAGDWVGNVALNGGIEYLVLALRQPGGSTKLRARLYSRAGGFSADLSGDLDYRTITLSGDDISLSMRTDDLAQTLEGKSRHRGTPGGLSFERL